MRIATPGRANYHSLAGRPLGPAPSEAVALGPSRDLGSPRSGEGADELARGRSSLEFVQQQSNRSNGELHAYADFEGQLAAVVCQPHL